MAEDISEDVGYDHAGRRKFHIDPFPHADEKNHQHCQKGQQKFIVEAGISAGERYDGVEQCEYMDGPSDVYIFQFEHCHLSFNVQK